MFWRTVRGMIPHKTARGAAAMERLKCFEGIPPPYDHKKRMVVPQALRVLRLKPGRKYCTVGRLGHEFGWKYQDVVARYESKRTVTLKEWSGADGYQQTRGEEKGQGCRLLRAQEGHTSPACRRTEERQRQRGHQEAAGLFRLLDGWDYYRRRVGSFGRCDGSAFLRQFGDICSSGPKIIKGICWTCAKSVHGHGTHQARIPINGMSRFSALLRLLRVTVCTSFTCSSNADAFCFFEWAAFSTLSCIHLVHVRACVQRYFTLHPSTQSIRRYTVPSDITLQVQHIPNSGISRGVAASVKVDVPLARINPTRQCHLKPGIIARQIITVEFTCICITSIGASSLWIYRGESPALPLSLVRGEVYLLPDCRSLYATNILVAPLDIQDISSLPLRSATDRQCSGDVFSHQASVCTGGPASSSVFIAYNTGSSNRRVHT